MTETMSRQERARHAEAVGRMLRGAGPRFAATMQTLLAGEPTLVQTSAVLQTAQVVENALQSGARQAAWLLYAGARACLEFDEEYQLRMDRAEGGSRSWDGLRQRAQALGRRLEGAGEAARTRWPAGSPSDISTGQRLAVECTALAEEIYPGWGWTRFEQACIDLQAERWEPARQRLKHLAEQRIDPVLRYAVARNHCSALLMADRAEELEQPLRSLEVISGGDVSWAYFLMEWSAARADRGVFDEARERFADLMPQDTRSYWVRYLQTRAVPMAANSVVSSPVIMEWIRGLPS